MSSTTASGACSASSKAVWAQRQRLLPERDRFLLGEVLRADEVALQPEQGVARLPLLHFLVGPVLRGVVGGRVRAQAVGEALDERGPLARAGPFGRELHRGVHGKDVVAVDADAGETVREGLFGQGSLLALCFDQGREIDQWLFCA